MEETNLNSLISTLLGGGGQIHVNPRTAAVVLKTVWRSKYKKRPNGLTLEFKDLDIPDRELSVLILHCSFEMTPAEVAREMKISLDKVWRDLRKAKFFIMNVKSYQQKYVELHRKILYGIAHPGICAYYI